MFSMRFRFPITSAPGGRPENSTTDSPRRWRAPPFGRVFALREIGRRRSRRIRQSSLTTKRHCASKPPRSHGTGSLPITLAKAHSAGPAQGPTTKRAISLPPAAVNRPTTRSRHSTTVPTVPYLRCKKLVLFHLDASDAEAGNSGGPDISFYPQMPKRLGFAPSFFANRPPVHIAYPKWQSRRHTIMGNIGRREAWQACRVDTAHHTRLQIGGQCPPYIDPHALSVRPCRAVAHPINHIPPVVVEQSCDRVDDPWTD
jgi:hypothetical protein